MNTEELSIKKSIKELIEQYEKQIEYIKKMIVTNDETLKANTFNQGQKNTFQIVKRDLEELLK